MKAQIIVQFDVEGFHNYPNAPTEVQFLEHKHRHVFQITAGYMVTNLNREKEIFLQRDELKFYLNECYGSPCEFGSMSCEMIAKELMQYGDEDGMVWCEVWEEKTGGARIEK